MNKLVYAGVLLQLLAVSGIDIKTKKISNRWALLNILAALLLYIFYSSSYPWNWEVLIFPAGWIVIGFLLFLLGIMGAGDSKYLASLFLLIPLHLHISLFEKVMISTICVGAIMLSFKVVQNFAMLRAFAFSMHWKGIKETIKSNFSYAPVVLIAWVLLGIDLWA